MFSPLRVFGIVTIPYSTGYQILEKTVGIFEVGIVDGQNEAETLIKNTLAEFGNSLRVLKPRIHSHIGNDGHFMDMFGQIYYGEETLTLQYDYYNC